MIMKKVKIMIAKVIIVTIVIAILTIITKKDHNNGIVSNIDNGNSKAMWFSLMVTIKLTKINSKI